MAVSLFPCGEVSVEVADVLPDGPAVPVGVGAAGEVVCEVAGDVLVAGEKPPQALRAPVASAVSRILVALGLLAGTMSPTVFLRSAVWLVSRGSVVRRLPGRPRLRPHGQPGRPRGLRRPRLPGLVPALEPVNGIEQGRDE
jgi:hypothetical protein